MGIEFRIWGSRQSMHRRCPCKLYPVTVVGLKPVEIHALSLHLSSQLTDQCKNSAKAKPETSSPSLCKGI